MRPLQGPGDEHLLELAAGVIVVHPAIEHLQDEAVELLAHESYWSSRPDSSRNASTYFARVRWMTSSGSEGTGGCLFHRICSR